MRRKPPGVVKAVSDFRGEVLRREARTMKELQAAYQQIVERTARRAESLARQINTMREAGEAVPVGRLVRLERYQLMMAELGADVEAFGLQVVTPAVTQLQGENVWLAQQHAAQIERIAIGDERALALQRAHILSPSANIEAAVGLMGDGKPVREYLRRSLPLATIDAVERAVADVVTGDLGPKQAARAMVREAGKASGIGLQRAMTITRTEGLRSYREAQRQRWQESDAVPAYRRTAAQNANTCIACIAMDGAIMPIDEPLDDHVNGRCLTPGTLVSGPVPEAFVSRHYRGDVVFIRTARGKELTVTPNHPILTSRGWVAAELINEGDDVVCDSGLQRAACGICPDEYQVPTPVENIARTLRMDRFGSMPTAAEDFHGDGRGSDVHVISTNRLLGYCSETTFSEPFNNKPFGFRDMVLALLVSLRYLTAVLFTMCAAPNSFLGNSNAAKMLFLRRVLCQQAVRLGLTSLLNAGFAEANADSRSRDAISFGERRHRFTGKIASSDFVDVDAEIGDTGLSNVLDAQSLALGSAAKQSAPLEFIRKALCSSVPAGSAGLYGLASNVVFDRVLEVNRRTGWSGQVYNLQTQTGWYIANSIITHNCSMVPVFVIDGEIVSPWRGQDARGWLAKQPEGTQLKVMGPGRLAAYKRGDVQLHEMARRVDHPTFGGAWVPRNVADIQAGPAGGLAGKRAVERTAEQVLQTAA